MREMKSSNPFIPTIACALSGPFWTSRLGVGELIVSRRILVPSIKLPEFLQTAYQTVVEWFLRPVFAFQIVEPFDEVKDSFVISSALHDRGYNFFDVVFLRLFDVVCLLQHL